MFNIRWLIDYATIKTPANERVALIETGIFKVFNSMEGLLRYNMYCFEDRIKCIKHSGGNSKCQL